ncbi:Na+/H+ antiporter family protein [Alkalicoccus halolimnae]|uniref:Na+/H+ antiporter family protein n=1 Tax=Alkalicoccus halolimnae TaxID=1667239 RepID=A0A5C7F9J8_9BACI|nr:Na+/H+ antiporter family protein [Alkalicoccus halolimnae]TXF87401.1 Na+/H+ antiporter family protein [Alkalicoccus halolimnae]
MNAVIVAVLVMIILSLSRIHVVLALLIGAVAGGLTAGFSVTETISIFSEGLGDNAQIALSYGLLGAFAIAISFTGLPELMVKLAIKLVGKEGESRRSSLKKALILFVIAIIASFSQNLVPVHIAFIPLLIPPLLKVFNELAMDRRAAATALTFGLKAPYILIPAGYGLIFHETIADNMEASGLQIALNDIPGAMALPVLGMVVGLFISILITYKNPRTYEDKDLAQGEESSPQAPESPMGIFVGLTAILSVLAAQVSTDSMIIGAGTGLIILYIYFSYLHITRKFTLQEADELMTRGMKMLAFIGFVMITAGGFAEVIRETGHVELLVESTEVWFNDRMGLAAIAMLLIGLFITMGIGSSFATVPILAAIFVPLAASLGFSPLATIALIGTAGALGDAGSPASDSTLGPTAGLNADGQHNHIWDTVVPTFLHFNIPLLIFGWIAAMIL